MQSALRVLVPRPGTATGGLPSCPNEFRETVTWTFMGVADVREALYDDLGSDTSLYSRGFDDLPRCRELLAFSSLAPRES